MRVLIKTRVIKKYTTILFEEPESFGDLVQSIIVNKETPFINRSLLLGGVQIVLGFDTTKTKKFNLKLAIINL